ncbi:MAG: hypothetical protein QF365_06175 [Candidatus Thalassarchaeaceae archaeon]|nr:hypothetical protein [Candidatus Thalassarchaeaceae archaeon]MDP6318501.1 hypothetical protein [Candidatus Thalassarchaeaceae archaeon]HIH80318.1 hypothetical protein [Candidatus Thalassarchaeaceae archaeon]HJM29781.1 hypothetical protein [Candidatus Thalassarchaeaceae archaeon]HJN70494.1 hypothetical protein [Candidatus Thalassarchaeaceae archaeon]
MDRQDVDARKRMRDIDRLRRESDVISRLLKQASLIELKNEFEQVNIHLEEVETNLES